MVFSLRQDKTDKAPVIDVMNSLSPFAIVFRLQVGIHRNSVTCSARLCKVCGKGKLPQQPVIVKARYFTKEAGKFARNRRFGFMIHDSSY